MESFSSLKKVLNKSEYILYLRFFKVASRWLDDIVAHCLLILLLDFAMISTSFTWNAFPTILKEYPHMLSTCWLLFLHSAVQLIPNHLNLVEVGRLWRPVHLMHHSITLPLGQIALTHPGGVLGHCPVEKQMIVPLSANQMGWHIAAECCAGHAG